VLKKVALERFFSQDLGFVLSVSFHRCSKHTLPSITDAVVVGGDQGPEPRLRLY
jgi:hypothetical protein